ncbi:MAG: peptidase domain-containing ABC transporter [Pseudomonadota bacterium]
MPDTEARSWKRLIAEPLRRHFGEVLTLSTCVNLLALAAPIFVLQVYDRVIFYSGLTTLQGLVLGMGLVLVFDFILRQARARLLQRVALRIDVELGARLFDKLASAPLRVLEARPTIYWQTAFRDLDVVRNTFSGATAILLVDLPFAAMFLAAVYILAPLIAWVFVAILCGFLVLSWRSGVVLDRTNAAENRAAIGRDGLVTEMIVGRTTVKALALADPLRAIWEGKHAAAIRRSLERGTFTDTYVNIGTNLTMFTTIAVTAVGALAIINQQMTVGTLIAANMLSGRIVAAFNQLFMSWKSYAMCRQSMVRLEDVFSLPEERREKGVRMARPKGEIVLERATFRYGKEQRPAVDNVSLKIPAGGMYGLVGRNGSGKTTLLKLMQGLYVPDSGRVLLDGADIAQYTRNELAHWVGYEPQECVLFMGTIRDNIARARPQASDEEVVRAAERAGAHPFIVDLPDGYASQIGEAGGRLSGGQRQRLTIARALVSDPAVLLLDEPTAFLDRYAEQDLKTVLVELAQSRTVVVVTHSAALLQACTAIVALEGGKVLLAGPTAEVLPRLARPRSEPVAVQA